MSRIKKLFSVHNIAELGVLLLLCAYPLFVTNYYYNITVSKMSFFAISASLAFFVCSMLTVMKADFSLISSKAALKKLTATDWFMAVFLFACTVSCLISDYRQKAFFGTGGRYMGLLMMIFVVLAYFFISKYYVMRERDLYIFAFAFSVLVAIGVLQFIGFDPFGFLAATPEKYHKNFIATLGNINVFSSYICICSPVAMYNYCFARKGIRSVIWLAVSCIGFLALFVCNSDGGYIGYGVAFVACGYMSLRSSDAVKKFFRLAAAFFICGKAFWLLGEKSTLDVREFSVMTQMVIAKQYTYIIIAVFVIISLVLWKLNLPEKLLKAARIAYVACAVLAVAAVAAVMVYFSVINTEAQLSGLGKLFRFNDDWGTFRGYAWRWTVTAFSDYPFINKLFGMGEDTLALVLRPLFPEEMRETGLYFDNAHNEFLQYLATVGLVGVISYIGALGTCVVKLLRGTSVFKSAFAVAVIAYAAQSCINILQPITSPLVFVFIGLVMCRDEPANPPALSEQTPESVQVNE